MQSHSNAWLIPDIVDRHLLERCHNSMNYSVIVTKVIIQHGGSSVNTILSSRSMSQKFSGFREDPGDEL